MVNDRFQAGRAGCDNLTGNDIGIDDIRTESGEPFSNRGFTARNAARKPDLKHNQAMIPRYQSRKSWPQRSAIQPPPAR